MLLTRIINVIAWVFLLLGTIYWALFGASHSKTDWTDYPLLKQLIEDPLKLFLAAVFFSVVSTGAFILKGFITEKPSLEVYQGPQGEITQKATPTGITREFKEAAVELANEAKDYFRSGERDFAKRRYIDAAGNYQKSINIVPTMSGYLNLGISLLYVSDFRRAEKALISGVQIARRKHNKLFEGAFLKVNLVNLGTPLTGRTWYDMHWELTFQRA